MSDEIAKTEEKQEEAPQKKKLTKKRATIAVDIDDEEYILTEMSGKVRDILMEDMSKRVKLDPKTGQPTGLVKQDGSLSTLIARCISKEGKPVSEDEIQTWPSSTQRELFDLCATMNGMNKEGAEAAKKD